MSTTSRIARQIDESRERLMLQGLEKTYARHYVTPEDYLAAVEEMGDIRMKKVPPHIARAAIKSLKIHDTEVRALEVLGPEGKK